MSAFSTIGPRAHPSVSLVADGLLSDPRHQHLHDRARRGVDRLEPVRSPRLFRARLRARVVVADSEDDRRPRDASKGSSGLTPGTTYVFVSNHQSIYDTPVIFSVAAVSAAHHRQGLAGAVSGARLAPEARRPSVRRSPEPRSRRHPDALARAGVRRAVAHHLRRRDAQPRRPRRAGSRPAASCWRSRPGCRSCRWRSSARGAVMPKGRLRTEPADVRLIVHDPIPGRRRSIAPTVRDAKALADAGRRPSSPADRRAAAVSATAPI